MPSRMAHAHVLTKTIDLHDVGSAGVEEEEEEEEEFIQEEARRISFGILNGRGDS